MPDLLPRQPVRDKGSRLPAHICLLRFNRQNQLVAQRYRLMVHSVRPRTQRGAPDIVERLAEAMRRLGGDPEYGQPVHHADLVRHGFTRAQLTDANVAKAHDLINQRRETCHG